MAQDNLAMLALDKAALDGKQMRKIVRKIFFNKNLFSFD